MALITPYWSTDLVAIFVGLSLAIYFYLTRNFNYWKKKGVPFLQPTPFFGNFFDVVSLKKCPGEFLADVYKNSKGPYVGIYIFDKPYLLLRDPELIKAVLVKDFNNFYDRTIATNEKDDVLGTRNLFIIKNPEWKEMRAKLTPIFTTGKMKNMFSLMDEIGINLINHIDGLVDNNKGHGFETKEVLCKYATDVIATCAFGIQANCLQDDNAEFRQMGRRLFHFTIRRAAELSSFFFAPQLVKIFGFMFFEPTCSAFLRQTFWDTMNYREKSKISRPDLFELLIKLRNESTEENGKSKVKFEGDTLVAQAAVFFSAGFETSASAISFTLYELCVNPEIQVKVREEIARVMQQDGPQLTYDKLMEMKFLHMCLLETLRKYPPLPFLDRCTMKKYKFPGTDLTIEPGTPVYIPMFGLQRDPTYFPDPETYDPQRFTEENKQKRPQYAYIPFGEGPHNCIGERFGLLSAKVGLIHILHNYEIQRSPETQVPLELDPKALILQPLNGIHLKFVKKPVA